MSLVQKIKEALPISVGFTKYIGGELKQQKDEYWACCPFHNESNPSFSLNDKKGKFNCFGCQKSGDVINLIAEYQGKTNGEVIKMLSSVLNLTTFTTPTKQNIKPKREHVYADEHGNLILKKEIYYDKDGNKKAGWWHWANVGWVKGQNKMKPPLYRLPELLQAIKTNIDPIYIVEGEKDTDKLRSIGLTATTNGSSKDFWTSEKIAIIPNEREIFILADNDDPGIKIAKDTASKLCKKGCRVKYILLPGLAEKGDVTDWLQTDGNTPEKLQQITNLVPYFTEDQPDSDYYNGFVVEDNNLGYYTTTKHGPVFVPISNFIPEPLRETRLDDGEEVDFCFEIRAKILKNDVVLSTLKIKAEEFTNVSAWAVKGWGLRANVYAGQSSKDKIREFIQHQAQNIERKTIYNHTGWRVIEGKRVYLHCGGAVGAENVEVDVSENGRNENLQKYRLPQACQKPQEAVQIALNTIDVADHKITIPLFSSVILGVSLSLCEEAGAVIDTTPFLVGRTQSGKSTIAALFLSFFGNFSKTCFPASFRMTANSIEKILFTMKDTVVVVDDFYPAQSIKERQDLNRAAQSLARGRGDGANRTRLNGDMKFRKTYKSRAFAIVTGEQQPDIGESGQARFLFLHINRNSIDYHGKLMELLKQTPILPQFTFLYIEWVAKNWDELVKQIPVILENANQSFPQEDSGRITSSGAQIYLGLWLGMAFLLEEGYISEEYCQEKLNRAMEVITELVKENIVNIVEEKPVQKFITALMELITTQKATVHNLEYETSPIDHIGYEDKDYLYLIPGVTYNLVNDFYSKNFPIGQRTVYKHLFEAGYIKADPVKRNRYTLQKHIPVNKRAEDLIWLKKSILNVEG